MAHIKGGFTVDIGEVMSSLAELGIPSDVQEDCLRLILKKKEKKERKERKEKKEKRPDQSAREIDRMAGGEGRASAAASHPISPPFTSFEVQAAQQAAQQAAELPLTAAPLIESAKSEDDDHVIMMPCLRSSVGRVIGKSGDTIKALQQYTKTSIQIDQSTDPTLVTISGSVKSVRIAVAMISDIIDGRFKGFAMLRQITRGEISGPGGGLAQQVSVLSSEGMVTSSARSSTSSRDIGDAWTPNYVQGYGFLPPPCAPLGQTGVPQIEPSRRSVDNYDISMPRSSTGAAWLGGSALYRTSSVGISQIEPQATAPTDAAHHALRSKMTPTAHDQHHTHMLEHETILNQQKASETSQDVLRALMQLRQMHTQAGEEKRENEDDAGSHGAGNLPSTRFKQDGPEGP